MIREEGWPVGVSLLGYGGGHLLSQCGNSVAEGSRFCSSCGTAVAGSATSSGAASAGVQGPSPAFGKTFGHESNPTFRFDVRRWGLGVNADRKGGRARRSKTGAL